MGTMRKAGVNPSAGRARTGLCGAGAALLLCGAPAAVDAGEIFWADWSTTRSDFSDDKIWTVNANGTGRTSILDVQRPIGIALDTANEYVYYAAGGDSAPGQIGRVKMNGTGHQVLVDGTNAATPFGDAQHLRLDLTNGKIYWASYHDGLRRANLDGSGYEVLQDSTVDGGDTRGHLALHVPSNALYYGSPATGNLFQTTLTAPGTFAEAAFDTPGAADLTISPAGDRLYWASGGAIQSNNLAGTDPQTLVTGLNGALGLTLSPDGSLVYWTERGTGQRLAFDDTDPSTPSNPQLITAAEGNAFGIGVVPEPGAAGVMLLAGGAMFLRRRRAQG